MAFSEKALASIHVPSKRRAVFMKFKMGISWKASFQTEWYNELPKRIRLPQVQSYHPLCWKIKFSKQVYLINIKLFSKTFCKNSYYSFNQNLLHGDTVKVFYFQQDQVRVKTLAYAIKIIPAIFFFRIVFGSVISGWNTVQGCCWEWKQGNFG